MRKGIVVMAGMLLTLTAVAQSAQIKVYLQQIAANKAYIDYAWKGYEIARQGLGQIGDHKRGHWRLDNDFFNRLGTVSPALRQYNRLGDIVRLSVHIASLRRELLQEVRQSAWFGVAERGYVDTMLARLGRSSSQLVEQTTAVVSSGLQMGDDERLRRIDALYGQLLDIYGFSHRLATDLRQLAAQRTREQAAVQRLRHWYGRP